MNRTYRVQRRNGHFAVDEHNNHNSGVTGPLFTGTRKDAEQVAYALNMAYAAGRTDAGRDIARAAEDLHTVANTAAIAVREPVETGCPECGGMVSHRATCGRGITAPDLPMGLDAR